MSIWTEFSAILKPSSLGGIGVFATHDIPKNTKIFTGSFPTRIMKVKDVPEEFLKYVVYVNADECKCAERFDKMEIGWYLNHSHDPNMIKLDENNIIAARDIKAGEEILIDYNQLNEPDYMKESYYQQD